MTERKPANMSFEHWIDAQIKEAQERGEFDNLPGKGKPLKGIDEPYDELWWVKQLMIREEISYLPPALAIRREAEQLLAGIGALPSEFAVRGAVEELNTRIRDTNRKPGLDGPPSALMPIDVDVVVGRWPAARAEWLEMTGRAPATAAEPVAEPVPSASPAAETAPAARRRRWWRNRRVTAAN